MTNLLYICLSDLHLGARTAILTDNPAVTAPGEGGTEVALCQAYDADPLRKALAGALTATLAAYAGVTPVTRQAGVVLLGDILDLSLGNPRRAIDDLDLLLKALAMAGGQKYLGRFVFVPGNHDHELWTVARYQRMVGKLRAEGDFDHITRAFDAPLGHPAAPLIDGLLRQNGFGKKVEGDQPSAVYYPNLGVSSADGKRAVVLHHGHFIEAAYRVMSNLVAFLAERDADDLDAEALEILNASWIDFMWSTDGDDGKLGRDIQLAYEYLLTGSEDLRFDQRFAERIAQQVMASLPLPKTAGSRKLVGQISAAVVDATVGQYGQSERFSYDQAMSPDGIAGLAGYIHGPVLKQIAADRPGQDGISELTFIFGHTHKPFEDRLVSPDFAKPPCVYNTGGWDLDTPMFDTKLGAALVFVDEELNVASLRLCHVPKQDGLEMSPDGPYPVHVATAEGDIAGNPLASRLDKCLQATRDAWEAFATEAEKAYRAKQAYSMAIMTRADALDRKPGKVL